MHNHTCVAVGPRDATRVCGEAIHPRTALSRERLEMPPSSVPGVPIPVWPAEQKAELDAIFARLLELGAVTEQDIAKARDQIESEKSTTLKLLLQYRLQLKSAEAALARKAAKDAAAKKAAARSRSPMNMLSTFGNCCLRLGLAVLVVACLSGFVASLSLASLASWESGGDAAGWACSLSLFLLLPCLCCLATTFLAASRDWLDSAETLCPTFWLVLTLAIGIGPMVAVCYVAGPSLLQAAAISRSGVARNVSVSPPATSGASSALRSEVSLVFAAGVTVDRGRIGVFTEAIRSGGVSYTRYTCVAPLVSAGHAVSSQTAGSHEGGSHAGASLPVLYWARDGSAVADKDAHLYPRFGRCFTPPESAADMYNRSSGVMALSMGTHYYSKAWGRTDAATELDGARQDAIRRFNLSAWEGADVTDDSLYVTVVDVLTGPGSALEHFLTEARPGIFWALAIPVIAACAALGLWLLISWFRACDLAEERDGKGVDYVACMCPGVRGKEVSWREIVCCPQAVADASVV